MDEQQPATRYILNEIYPTVQGEGTHVGIPMTIVRLQGCGVGCPWCDSVATWPSGVSLLSADNIASEAAKDKIGGEIALITGGEPANYHLRPLVRSLKSAGFKAVHLETSGTAIGHIGAGFDWVTISPKFGMRLPTLHKAFAQCDELKAVIPDELTLDALDAFLPTIPPPGRLSIQPVFGDPSSLSLCLRTAMDRGWRLSIQTHKHIGIK